MCMFLGCRYNFSLVKQSHTIYYAMCKYDGYDQYMYDMMGGTYLVKQFTEKDTDTNKKT